MAYLSASGRYCMYLRRSRADMEEEQRGAGETLRRHYDMLTELAGKYGVVIGESAVYREIVSGDTISERPVVRRLLNEVERGTWDGVFVTEMSRLARGDTLDQGIVSNTFMYSNTLIITPQKIYDLRNQMDEGMAEMDLFMARFEYRQIKRRLQAGRVNSVKNGLYVGSIPPYGYERYKLDGQRGYSLRIIEDQAACVRLMKNMYINGVDGVHMGCETIAQRLNEMGFRSQNGLLWTGSAIRTILKNPTYWGKIWWSRRVQRVDMVDGKKIKTRVPATPIVVDGVHPAIFEDDDFEIVQRLIKSRCTAPNSVKTGCKNIFAGFTKCGLCGKAMIRQINPRKPEWDMLKCSNPNCATSSAYITTVESAILDILRGWVDRFDSENISVDAPHQPDKNELAIANAEKQIAVLKKQLSKIRDLLEQGIYSTDVYLERQNDINARVAAQQSVLDALKNNAAVSLDDMIRMEIPAIKNMLELYRFATTPGEKNDLFKTVIGRVLYFKTEKNARLRAGENLRLEVYPVLPK